MARPDTLINAPALELDKVLHPDRIPPHVVRERRTVWALLTKLYEAGYTAYEVEGEKLTDTSARGAMEMIFDLDEALVMFCHRNHPREWVKLVRGNDCDIVSDYGVREASTPFGEILDAFDGEDYA